MLLIVLSVLFSHRNLIVGVRQCTASHAGRPHPPLILPSSTPHPPLVHPSSTPHPPLAGWAPSLGARRRCSRRCGTAARPSDHTLPHPTRKIPEIIGDILGRTRCMRNKEVGTMNRAGFVLVGVRINMAAQKRWQGGGGHVNDTSLTLTGHVADPA